MAYVFGFHFVYFATDMTVSVHFHFSAADYLGEKLAWFFGITSPKYQYAIDEYEKMKAEVSSSIHFTVPGQHGISSCKTF